MHPKRPTSRHPGGVLRVLNIGRVSTPGQPQSNIEAGFEYGERRLKEMYDGPVYIKRLGEQGSGMLVHRPTIVEAYEEIRSGNWDVVLMEDVSKSYRNPRWIYAFVQDCVDLGVRVIAPGDGLDTAQENWEVVLAAAALRHGLHIPDTRRRVRRTGIKSFNEGGMVLRVRFGYRKLSKADAESGLYGRKGLRLARLDELTDTIRELRRMVVVDRKGGAALADWLDEEGIKPPPYAKRKKWSGKLVLDLLRDPILYGLRQFPKVNHIPRFSDGKHTRSKNPSPDQNLYGELAHMTREQFEEMQVVLDEIGAARAPRSPAAAATKSQPRARVPRDKSITPLQHATCEACADFMYLVGNGVIKCKNALTHRAGCCWNHVQVDCERVRREMIDWLMERVDACLGARDALLDAAWEQMRRSRRRSESAVDELTRRIEELKRRGRRLGRAIERGGRIKPLIERLRKNRRLLKKACRARKRLQSDSGDCVACTRETLALDPRAALLELARTSYEFAELMRKVFPSVVIQPVQALDSGLVRPRARLTLDLGALLPSKLPASVAPPAPETRQVDLFDPPVHIQHVRAVVGLKAAKLQAGQKASLSVLAAELKINRMTVKRALAYDKLMRSEGLADPYRVLNVAPAAASRWKPSKRRVGPTPAPRAA